MTYPFGARIPRVLSNNKVVYDTSAMVHSHLIHLLRHHLNGSAIQQQSIRFHNVQYLRLESKAPCGGLTSKPVLSLPRGHPFILSIILKLRETSNIILAGLARFHTKITS